MLIYKSVKSKPNNDSIKAIWFDSILSLHCLEFANQSKAYHSKNQDSCIVHIYHLFIVSSTASEFLLVRPGDYVVIKNEENCQDTKKGQNDYWIGHVINCIGGARNPNYGPCFK